MENLHSVVDKEILSQSGTGLELLLFVLLVQKAKEK